MPYIPHASIVNLKITSFVNSTLWEIPLLVRTRLSCHVTHASYTTPLFKAYFI